MATFNELLSAAQMAGFTFDRARIGRILSEISRQKKSAKDYVGDTRMVRAVMEKDFSRYGLVQAVTFQAHDAKDDETRDLYDDAGAKVLASSLKTVLA